MTLSDFATFSTAISGIAVTASVIYLAIQTRQNSRHTRALIQQGATARTTSIMLAMQNSQSSAAWVRGNGAEPTPEAISMQMFNLQCGTAINAMEDFFHQNSDGLLTAELFARNCETFRGLLSEPGMRDFWNSRRDSIGRAAPKFRAFVDGLCVEEATEFGYRV